jgi:hypothetical protein
MLGVDGNARNGTPRASTGPVDQRLPDPIRSTRDFGGTPLGLATLWRSHLLATETEVSTG